MCAHIGHARAIAFWARASRPVGVAVVIANQSNTPVGNGGWCYSPLCSPAVGAVRLSSEWGRFELPFDSFFSQPPGWFEGFRSFEMCTDISPAPGPIELWMDDPEFVR